MTRRPLWSGVPKFTIRVDPNPCLRYRWPDAPRCTSYNGGHCCELKGGHKGPCRCSVCEREADGPDRSTDLPDDTEGSCAA